MTGWELLALRQSQAENLSIFEPAAPPSQSIRTLSILLFAIAALIFVVVEGVLFYNLLRFRKTTGGPATEPPQVYGGKPIEIAWTVAPTLIVCILVLVLSRTLWEIELDPPPAQTGRQLAVRHRRRPAMVVGIPLRQVQRPPARLHHGQRAAHSGRQRRRPTARVSRPAIGRRHVTASGCRGWPARPT